MPYKVVMCKNCGLMYINPVPSKEELNNFYVHKYESYYGIPAQYGDSNFKVRGYEIYDFLKGNVETAEKILEIGAGGGGNILGLSEKYNSKELAVIEPGAGSNISLSTIGVQIIGEFYDEEILDLRRFDLIVLSHVLEHFYEPKEVLRKIWNDTAENVNLFIAIPSLSAINKETFNYSSKMEDYWLRVVHLTYFHQKNIEDMLRITGWKIKKKQKKNGELFILAEKNSKPDKEGSIQNVYEEHLNEVLYYKNMTDFIVLYKRHDQEEKRLILFGASNMENKHI
ncbi:methyltransferase domain protein [Sporosarcina newyorkensis 2681]|uniref:Methyltransferase domain protein n=1 Tax=Sporosarcina newyorkensis 2681 TaxID=1027292 RepID=F9DQ88_9BACL|nr:methyltransferase domain-containing protein [Sporosarcina newyorkensis]EGQ26938.1 methyltransferase domain protein [Sporosarcina newyorkensis 2681]